MCMYICTCMYSISNVFRLGIPPNPQYDGEFNIFQFTVYMGPFTLWLTLPFKTESTISYFCNYYGQLVKR